MAPTLANDPESFLIKAGRLVFDVVKNQLEKAGKTVTFEVNDLDVIWFTKDSQDWKILFRTPLQDGVFYRVVHNSVDREVRIDAFRQFDQVVLSNKEFR
jgi:hypothetical protein